MQGGEGDLAGSALAPPSSSVDDDGGGGGSHQLHYRPAAPGSSSQAQHTHPAAAAAAAAALDRDAASTFFSEASASDPDGSYYGGGTTTEDDGTLRGIDVDIISHNRYRSPTRPGPGGGRAATPSTLGGGQSPTPVFSPGAMSSPGNTSLSSTNLSPHQQKRYGGSSSGGGGAHRGSYHRHRPPAPPDIMTQSGMLLGSDMLVPTLGVPVVGSQQQQQQQQRQGAAVGKHSTKNNKTALENGRGPNTSSRPASATPSSSDTDGYMKQSHHKSKRITGSSGSNTSGAPNGGIPPLAAQALPSPTMATWPQQPCRVPLVSRVIDAKEVGHLAAKARTPRLFIGGHDREMARRLGCSPVGSVIGRVWSWTSCPCPNPSGGPSLPCPRLSRSTKSNSSKVEELEVPRH